MKKMWYPLVEWLIVVFLLILKTPCGALAFWPIDLKRKFIVLFADPVYTVKAKSHANTLTAKTENFWTFSLLQVIEIRLYYRPLQKKIFFAELHYAQKELGDHNVVIYEAFFYTKLERIFAPYYRILAYHKMIYDAVDEDLVKNPEKLKAYLDDINEKMDLRGDLSLTPEKLQPNKSMRMTIKLLQNSGKVEFFGVINQSNIKKNYRSWKICTKYWKN